MLYCFEFTGVLENDATNIYFLTSHLPVKSVLFPYLWIGINFKVKDHYSWVYSEFTTFCSPEKRRYLESGIHCYRVYFYKEEDTLLTAVWTFPKLEHLQFY